MNTASAIRYLETKGWELIDQEWFRLKGMYEEPVCVDTAYELQKMLDQYRQVAA